MKLCDLKVAATLLQDEWKTDSGTRHQVLNVLLQYIVMMSFPRYCVLWKVVSICMYVGILKVVCLWF